MIIVLDILPIIYTISSVLSIILAITAIWFSLSVEKRLKQNFMNLKSLIELQHQMNEELMDNINQEISSQWSIRPRPRFTKHYRICERIVKCLTQKKESKEFKFKYNIINLITVLIWKK
ncbi:MAG: hypothetical protein Q7V10_00355 [Methanobacteriaceae archaeon]|nr:hypothetical protein [Methanobacteriaceae archaeon]MDO9627929.1 hypothetical protein [Methanobacteriaceae archaeon]